MNRVFLAWIALVLTTMAWASSLVLAKIVYAEMTPIVFVALRYTLASPLLIVLFLSQKDRYERAIVSKKNWRVLTLAGLSGPFLSQVLQYIGLSMTTAAEALLLLNTSPIFAVVLAYAFISEPITLDKIGGLFLATLGVSLIVIGGTSIDTGFGFVRLLGDGIIVVSTFLFAVNGIAGKVAVRLVDSISVTTFSTLIAVPCIWICAIVSEDVTVIFRLSLNAWLIIVWVGVVNSVIAFILYYESMKYIEASRVQIALNLISVWGVLMSVLVLGETTSVIQIIGGALTIIGVIVAQRMIHDNTQKNSKTELDSNML
jgi:drug/metabolite transporter (DMT)-like permease